MATLDPKAKLDHTEAIEEMARYVLARASEPLEQRLANCILALCGQIHRLDRDIEDVESKASRPRPF
jgi:hypothetical protein